MGWRVADLSRLRHQGEVVVGYYQIQTPHARAVVATEAVQGALWDNEVSGTGQTMDAEPWQRWGTDRHHGQGRVLWRWSRRRSSECPGQGNVPCEKGETGDPSKFLQPMGDSNEKSSGTPGIVTWQVQGLSLGECPHAQRDRDQSHVELHPWKHPAGRHQRLDPKAWDETSSLSGWTWFQKDWHELTDKHQLLHCRGGDRRRGRRGPFTWSCSTRTTWRWIPWWSLQHCRGRGAGLGRARGGGDPQHDPHQETQLHTNPKGQEDERTWKGLQARVVQCQRERQEHLQFYFDRKNAIPSGSVQDDHRRGQKGDTMWQLP